MLFISGIDTISAAMDSKMNLPDGNLSIARRVAGKRVESIVVATAGNMNTKTFCSTELIRRIAAVLSVREPNNCVIKLTAISINRKREKRSTNDAAGLIISFLLSNSCMGIDNSKNSYKSLW